MQPEHPMRYRVLTTVIASLFVLIMISNYVIGESFLEERRIKSDNASYYYIVSISWKPDGTQLAGSVADGSLKIWDPMKGTLIKTVPVGSSRFVVDWSYSGDTLVTLGSDSKVKTWDPAAGANTGSFEVEQSSLLFALSPTENSIGIIYNKYLSSSIISIWNYDTGRFYYNLTGIDENVNCISWSLGGDKIAAGRSDGQITIWDVNTQQIEANLTSADSSIYSIAWSPDGKMIAGGCSNYNVKIWDVSTGKIKKTMVMHTSTIHSVSWSRDGKYIASGSSDKTARVWNGTTGADISNLDQHTQSVSWVAFSYDSRFLASASDDGYIIIYQKEFIDLKISSFTIDKNKIGPNENGQISVTIRNDGNVPAANQKIEFYDENTLLETKFFTVSNGSNVTLNFDYHPPASAESGNHRISVKVNGIQENRSIEIERQLLPQLFGTNGFYLELIVIAIVLLVVLIAIIAYRRSSRRKTTIILTDLQRYGPQKSLTIPLDPISRQGISQQAAPTNTSITSQLSITRHDVQTTAQSGVQRQVPSAVISQATSVPQPSGPRNVELKSALDFISGFLVMKIAILNQSSFSLTRCSLSIDYNRKVFFLDRVQPQTYDKDRSGDKVIIGEILPGDRRTTVEFYLDPYICTGGDISAIFSFHDHFGQPHDIRLQPRKVDVLCPVLTAKTIDPSQLNSPSMWAIFDRLAHKNARAVNVSGMSMDIAFEQACQIVEKRDVRRIRKGMRPEGMVGWYYGKTPKMEGTDQEWDFLINVWRKPDCNSVEFMVAADSQGAITGLLSKLGEEFTEMVERQGYSKPVTKIINITDSVIYKSSLECV